MMIGSQYKPPVGHPIHLGCQRSCYANLYYGERPKLPQASAYPGRSSYERELRNQKDPYDIEAIMGSGMAEYQRLALELDKRLFHLKQVDEKVLDNPEKIKG